MPGNVKKRFERLTTIVDLSNLRIKDTLLQMLPTRYARLKSWTANFQSL